MASSFFMKDSLMGDFAKGRIQELIHWLQQDVEASDVCPKWLNTDSAKILIEQIGEPLLRSRLKELWNDHAKRQPRPCIPAPQERRCRALILSSAGLFLDLAEECI
jgi:hypothetical protein